MEKKAADRLLRVRRNKGILGQEALMIKNEHCIWSLRLTGDRLLGRCSLDMGQTWTEWMELASNYNGFFSFTVSEVEKLHLTCKNTLGHLVYVCWRHSDIESDVLTDKWVEDERITYQSVVVDHSGTPSIIYFTDNPLEEVWRVKHCYRGGDGEWSRPEVIDSGLGPGQIQGAVALDQEGIIHLVYQYSTRSKSQFVYRARFPDARWTEPARITDSSRSNLYPCLVADEAGTLHLVWTRSDGKNYRVMYRRRTRGGWMVGGWQNELFLSSPGVNAYTPTLGIWNDRVVVFWQQTEGIYQCTSLDGGKTFNDPVLKDRYHRLFRTNMLALDLLQKQGLSSIATFDNGSTLMALLAAVFQSDGEAEELHPSLPEAQDFRPLEPVFPSVEYLSLDYGQKGLSEHIRRIDGNFRRLFFELEDSRLTNAQMRETIAEQNERIDNLNTELEKAAQEISSLKNLARQLADKLNTANGKIKALEKEKQLLKYRLETARLENQELVEENGVLRQKIQETEVAIRQSEKKEAILKQQLDEQAAVIVDLIRKTEDWEAEASKNVSFWKRLF